MKNKTKAKNRNAMTMKLKNKTGNCNNALFQKIKNIVSKFLPIAIVLAIMPIAFADDAISLSSNSITIEPGQSIGIQAEIANNTYNNKCYSFGKWLGNDASDQLETQMLNSFCLNKGESTSFIITITAYKNAILGSYSTEFFLRDGQTNATIASKALPVTITDSGKDIGVERTESYYICREPYTQRVPVRITNNTGSQQEILIEASHELLLPEFEFQSIRLNSGSASELDLIIHTNSTTPFGQYRVPVAILAGNKAIQREISFALEDCGEKSFSISVYPENRAMKRNESRQFTVRIENNLTDEGQFVSVGLESDLNFTVKGSAERLFVAPNGSKEVSFTVSSQSNASFGKHEINVIAWSQKAEKNRKIKVEITGEHIIQLLAKNNDFEARTCSATKNQVFEVEVFNKGAYDEDIMLSIENNDPQIQAKLSESTIRVKKDNSRKIFVFVAPSLEASKGNRSITLVARASNAEARESLNFKVVSEEAQALGVIEITVYPSEITLNAGEDKQAAFTITNRGSDAIRGLKLSISGKGTDVYFFPNDGMTIPPGKSVTITAKLHATANAETSTRFAILEASANGAKASKEMAIKVKDSESANPAWGQITGFFNLSGSSLGAIAIIIVLITGTFMAYLILRKP